MVNKSKWRLILNSLIFVVNIIGPISANSTQFIYCHFNTNIDLLINSIICNQCYNDVKYENRHDYCSMLDQLLDETDFLNEDFNRNLNTEWILNYLPSLIEKRQIISNLGSNLTLKLDPNYIEVIELIDLDLKYIDFSLLKNFQNLKLFNLSHNKIEKYDLNYSSNDSIENIDTIDLSYNKLTLFEFNLNVRHLRLLNLSFNLIKRFDDINLKNVAFIDLSFNQLNYFKALKNFKKFYLEGNYLTDLNDFDNFFNICLSNKSFTHEINFLNNKWKCNCRSIEIIKYLKHNNSNCYLDTDFKCLNNSTGKLMLNYLKWFKLNCIKIFKTSRGEHYFSSSNYYLFNSNLNLSLITKSGLLKEQVKPLFYWVSTSCILLLTFSCIGVLWFYCLRRLKTSRNISVIENLNMRRSNNQPRLEPRRLNNFYEENHTIRSDVNRNTLPMYVNSSRQNDNQTYYDDISVFYNEHLNNMMQDDDLPNYYDAISTKNLISGMKNRIEIQIEEEDNSDELRIERLHVINSPRSNRNVHRNETQSPDNLSQSNNEIFTSLTNLNSSLARYESRITIDINENSIDDISRRLSSQV